MPMTMPKQMPYFQDDDMPEGVATGVMADFSHFSSAERLERAAVLDERMPLARELHDGALQSLSAATLQLETLSRLRVEVEILDDRVYLVVADDGGGFPFRGRYDLAELTAKESAPVSPKERVASLRGQLALSSTLSGSRLEISLPLHQPPLSLSPHEPIAKSWISLKAVG